MGYFWVHPYLVKRMEEVRRRDLLRQVAHWRLLHLAGVQRQNWLSRQGRWLLCQVGRFLERTGQWLQEQVPLQAT
jgi:hypothetical protein